MALLSVDNLSVSFVTRNGSNKAVDHVSFSGSMTAASPFSKVRSVSTWFVACSWPATGRLRNGSHGGK